MAQFELEFAPPSSMKVTPATLREVRDILQQRLETFFAPGQKFSVTLGAGTLTVRLETSTVSELEEVEAVAALCTAVGKLEFIDSEVALETGEGMTDAGLVIFTDEDIQRASTKISEFGDAVIELELTSEGTEKLAAYSSKNVGRFLVIVNDGVVVSSPAVQSEILDGKVWLQSNFTLEEANLLAAQLVGRLPFPLSLVGQN